MESARHVYIKSCTASLQVALSDQANGRVVADAVLMVSSGVSTDHVTYLSTLPSVNGGHLCQMDGQGDEITRSEIEDGNFEMMEFHAENLY